MSPVMGATENDGPGYGSLHENWQITTVFESKQRVELERAGVESSLVVDVKCSVRNFVFFKNTHTVWWYEFVFQ